MEISKRAVIYHLLVFLAPRKFRLGLDSKQFCYQECFCLDFLSSWICLGAFGVFDGDDLLFQHFLFSFCFLKLLYLKEDFTPPWSPHSYQCCWGAVPGLLPHQLAAQYFSFSPRCFRFFIVLSVRCLPNQVVLSLQSQILYLSQGVLLFAKTTNALTPNFDPLV